ncbi:hypothetical protein JA1_003502 [Spathaspora sp. JA1]|nr:hypothetical protein JA1_003502 [Spathaspora sp. JA1]
MWDSYYKLQIVLSGKCQVFTILNMGEEISWLHENSNTQLIKRIVFRVNGKAFDCARVSYPWIDAMVEDEVIYYRPYYTNQNQHSTHLMLAVTIYVARMNDRELQKIPSLCVLKELRVKFYKKSQFDKLLSIDFKKLPIKSLSISFSSIMATDRRISKFHEVFNLNNLTTFQLDWCFTSDYEYISEYEILKLLSKLSNVKHNSPYIKLSQVSHAIQRFQIEDFLQIQQRTLPRLHLSNTSHVTDFL